MAIARSHEGCRSPRSLRPSCEQPPSPVAGRAAAGVLRTEADQHPATELRIAITRASLSRRE